jgi:hypothetical protein
MSQKDIVDKLNESLIGSIDTECQVVYVLVEVRKLLERDKVCGDFRSLKFCCDWAAHANLSREPAKAFVKEIDDLFDRLPDNGDRGAGEGDLAEIMYLARFREDLQNCLKVYKLPTKAFDDEQRWQEFLRLYSLVIQDCPLTYEGGGKNLDEVVITKAEKVGPSGEQAFETKWELRLRGRTVSVFFLYPDGKVHTEPS